MVVLSRLNAVELTIYRHRAIPYDWPTRWSLLFGLSVIPSALCFVIAIFWLPESPHYLAQVGKKEAVGCL